jgi:ATP-dependent Clp protease ATP-binding subunit ClpA
MLGQKLEFVMNLAIRKANNHRHEYLTLEGVLWAILEDPVVQVVLKDCGTNPELILQELEEFIGNESNFSILSDDEIEVLNKGQFVDEELRQVAKQNGIYYQPEISLALQRVIQRAAVHVQSAGKKYLYGINVLVAMYSEKESYATYLLRKHGIERLNLIQRLAHGIDRPVTPEQEEDTATPPTEEPTGRPSKKRVLQDFTQNLNELALSQRLDPIIGRESEVQRIFQVLCRRNKNNPLLVGAPGVGKTAMSNGLVWAIIQGKAPPSLQGTTVYSLDLSALLAGAKFRGDLEGRLKNIFKELESEVDQGNPVVLFIDDLHTVMGAGAVGGGSMDAANLLRPVLSSGKIRCMGSTTHEEYRRFIEKDRAFERRFQKIDIDAPSQEDTYNILYGLKPRFEKHHNVLYSPGVLRTAIELSERFILDRSLPDKAIDIIDEAGASLQFLPSARKRTNVTVKDIENIVSYMAKVPRLTVAGDEKEKLKNLRHNLKKYVFGQDEALDKVCDAVWMARSGLSHRERTLANFLFAGPTGVGKTELAKQLASQLGVHFERFDMSEYMEKHAVSKLIGAPPGYIGHEQGGILTDAIKKNPHTVLLLDEIEKAHEDIYNILLQVMDRGILTDAHGRGSDFRNVILIMTTNAGAKDMESGSIGLSAGEGSGAKRSDRVLKNFFTPEFRNRLDGIIHFHALGEHIVLQIVHKFIDELSGQLEQRKVDIKMAPEVYSWLAKKGLDPKMGARPLQRTIDQEIKRPLSQEILFGKLEKGGKVSISLAEEQLQFDFFSS